MKFKLLLISIVFIITGCGGIRPPDGPYDAVIPRVGVFRADGDPSEWKGSAYAVKYWALPGEKFKGGNDFQAEAYLGYTDAGLLVGFCVTDDTGAEGEKDDELWKGDSVEVLFNTKPGFGGLYQVVAAPGRTEKQNKPRFYIHDYRSDKKLLNIEAHSEVYVRKNKTGYTGEMLIPFELQGLKPEKDTGFFLKINVNDLDPDKEKVQLTFAETFDPELMPGWYSILLADSAAGQQDMAASVSMKGFSAPAVFVNAPGSLEGKEFRVVHDDEIVGRGTFLKKGSTCVGSVLLPVVQRGEKEKLPFYIITDQIPGAVCSLPDLERQRKNLFRFTGIKLEKPVQDRFADVAFMALGFGDYVFTSGIFPVPDFKDPVRVRQAMQSDYTVSAVYYGSEGNAVEVPEKEGRYGAEIRAVFESGEKESVRRILFRIPAKAGKPDNTTEGRAEELAAAAILKRPVTAADMDPSSETEFWWYKVDSERSKQVKYPYFDILPEAYGKESGKKWPCIIYLHGSGGRKAKDLSLDPFFRNFSERKDFPCLVIVPHAKERWSSPAIESLIDDIFKIYRIDEDRLYLTGFSMGGMGTWRVALDIPERFAAIAPVGGRSGDPDRAVRLKDVPVWVFNGEKDTTTTTEDALKMVNALKEADADVKFTEIEGADHMKTRNTVYAMDELYEWFLTQRRQKLEGRK